MMERTGRGARRLALLPLAALAAACGDLNGPGGAAPAVQLTAPVDGTEIDADSVIITGVATDDAMVVRITTQVTRTGSGGGAEVEVPIAMARAVAFSGTVHDLPSGDFSLTVRAYDAEARSGQKTIALYRSGLFVGGE
jgi:hypothetical protein